MTSPDRAHMLTDLALELQRAPTEELTTKAMVDRALEFVPGSDAVSLTLRARRHTYTTLAATSEVAGRADKLQYRLKEGPCVAAADGAEWYRCGDIGRDSRWPEWGPQAVALGFGSLLSVRLMTERSAIGALNFYARDLEGFSDPDHIDLAVLYATHVAIALTNAMELAGLATAMQSRHIIGMAQGILMERYDLDIHNSFELLKRYSNALNTPLSAIADDIVRTRKLPHLPT